MKKIFLLLTICFTWIVNAQTLKSGNYVGNVSLTQDLGNSYTVIIKHEDNIITLTEPNRVSQYKSSGGNIYWHTEAKYANVFYLKVESQTKFYAGKKGEGEGSYTYQDENTNVKEVLPSGANNCPLYEKYLKLTETESNDTQGWVFCGAAALVKCTYTDVSEHLPPIIKGLKLITEDQTKCPCSDVITQNEWNSVTID